MVEIFQLLYNLVLFFPQRHSDHLKTAVKYDNLAGGGNAPFSWVPTAVQRHKEDNLAEYQPVWQ